MLNTASFLRSSFLRCFVSRAPFYCGLFLLAGLGARAQAYSSNPVFDSPSRLLKADVDVLAVSTAIRDSSGNQDVYLATIRVKGQAPQLAKLIDTYPSYSKPIRRDILRSRAALRMTLLRFPDLDSPGHDIFLAVDTRNVFDPAVHAALAEQQGNAIPCFTVVHGQTRLAH